MSRPKGKDRVERIEDWDEARYAIVPPRATLDQRLTLIHFRLLTLLGRINTRQGWAEMSQTAFAESNDYNRGSVVRAVGELVSWGYLEKRGQEQSGSARCHYRVLVDEVEPGHASGGRLAAGESPEATKTCHPAGDTPGKGTCHVAGDTGVTREATHVSPRKDTPIDQRSKIPPPYPPQPAVEGGGGEDSLNGQATADGASKPSPLSKGWSGAAGALGDIAASVTRRHVADFVAAVGGTLSPPKGLDPGAYVRQLASQLAEFPADVLATLAEAVQRERKYYLPAVPDLVAQARGCVAVMAARRDVALPDDPEMARRTGALRGALSTRIGEARFSAWCKGLMVLGVEDGTARVSLPSPYLAQVVDQQFASDLDAVAPVIGAERVRVDKAASKARSAA